MVTGDPNGGYFGTYLSFYFQDKNQYGKLVQEGKNPTVIRVEFYPEEDPHRKPIPDGGITDWGSNDLKTYGDMKVARIRIVDRRTQK